jgi:NDP-sugar pyrophosphorylase family protein
LKDFASILPKALLPIFDKPLISYQIDNLARIGVSRIIVIIRKTDFVFNRFLKTYKHNGVDIEVLYQNEFPGLGGALLTVEDVVEDDFVVILGDDLTISDSIANFNDFYFKHDRQNTQAYVREYDVKKISQACGVTIDDNNKIQDIVEKPTSFTFEYRGIGLYAFNRKIFDVVKKTPTVNNEIRLTDSLRKLSSESSLMGYLLEGYNFNINTIDDLLNARNSIYRREIGASLLNSTS